MVLEFPYQLVIFLDKTPEVGEPVYYGKHGWYPQIAVKRRFKLVAGEEPVNIAHLTDYFSHIDSLTISLGDLVTIDRMSVSVIEVDIAETLVELHHGIIECLGDLIVSRYPDRDGANYFPHVTAEYNDKLVLDVSRYARHEFDITSVWLLKDVDDENSVAYAQFPLSPFARNS